ncbi:MAG: hypothetical protein ACYTGF_10565 [Planctomycetota bacterium]|jgi:hypothetical protein
MKTTLKSALVLAAAVLLAGCGGEEEPAPPSAGGVLPADIGSTIGDTVNETASALAKNYASELDKQESQIDSLKASSLTLADDKLNELISAIETKLDAARGKLGPGAGSCRRAQEGLSHAGRQGQADACPCHPSLAFGHSGGTRC